MNFHVASRGSPLTLTFQQGGGACLNYSNKTFFKKFLARSCFINLLINLLYLVRQAK